MQFFKHIEDKHEEVLKHCLTYNKAAGVYTISNRRQEVYGYVKLNFDEYLNLHSLNYEGIFKELDMTKFSHTPWYTQGPYLENDTFISTIYRHIDDEENSEEEIPYGLYEVGNSCNLGIYLKPMKINSDEYIDIRKGSIKDIYARLTEFINNREAYKEEKVKHREGIILFGAPGNGKTMEICKILENSKKDNILSIYIPETFYIGNLSELRPALEGKLVVFVIEELTGRTSDSRIEALNSFCDGETSWNNAFIIATTNYPEELPRNVIDRPGRFDLILEFGPPSYDELIRYLNGRGIIGKEAEDAAKEAKGLSLDYIANAVTHSRIRKVSIVSHLRNLKTTRSKILENFKEPAGFRSRCDSIDEYPEDCAPDGYDKPVRGFSTGD